MNIKNIFLSTIWTLIAFIACSSDNKPINPESPVYDMSGFAKGADVSWLTEMERSNIKFYDSNDHEKECMALLRDLGMNSIRLRVWVDPVDGWCNKDDLLIKAFRANNLGMRLMIDFHYSDSWADPGKQEKPGAWADMNMEELQVTVASHTREVLNELKAYDIIPEWVQVGNETGNGMLWEEGKASVNMKNYAKLNNAGYDAVKEVFPNTKVIVHLHNGDDNELYRWLFDGLKNNGGKWDVIGMSLYPAMNSWQRLNVNCIANIRDMISRYGSEIMICEVGMPWDEAEACQDFLTDLMAKVKAIENDHCLGVFYWEPQSYGGWKGYTLGAFDEKGRPTVALNVFKC